MNQSANSSILFYSYTEMFEPSATKHFFCAISALNIVAAVPLLYGIIIYERNCHYRTLINQLVSSMLWLGIAWLMLDQIPFLLRFWINVPFPDEACSANLVFRNSITMQLFFLMDFTALVKFVFLFKFKNPTALQDDFWTRFLNVWSLTISFPSQIVFMLLPGRNPQSFYFCTGKFPMEFSGQRLKQNWSANGLALSSLLIHMVVGIRTCVFKRKARVADVEAMGLPAAAVDVASCVDQRKKTISSQTLVSITTNVLLVVTMHLVGIIPIYVNIQEPTFVDQYPNYILAFIQNILIYPAFFLLLGMIHCIRNEDLRKFLRRNIMKLF